MAAPKKNDNFTAFLLDLQKLVAKHLGDEKATAAVEDVVEADVEETPAEPADERAALMKKTVAVLRKQVKAMDMFDDELIAGADKDTLIDTILEYAESQAAEAEDAADDEDADEADDSEDADDEEGDDEEDGEEEGYSREELEALTLRELKTIATDSGYSAADLKGLTKPDLVETLLQEEDEDEDADEEDEVDSDEEETEDEEESDGEEWYTEEELDGMSLAEVKALAKEYKVAVKPGKKKAEYVAELLALGE